MNHTFHQYSVAYTHPQNTFKMPKAAAGKRGAKVTKRAKKGKS